MSWFSHIFELKKHFERPLEVLNEICISEKALLSNYDYLASLHSGVDIFPVLKANAYGHGIEQVATILKKRKPSYLVADSYYEALRIHAVNSTRILLVGYNLPENYEKMDFDWVTPVIIDLATTRILGDLDRSIRIHIKIDTGMKRQGITLSEIPEFIELLQSYPKLKLEGICTHLSDADNSKDNTFSFFQTEHFKKAIELIENAGHKIRYRHISNSAGHIKGIGRGIANAARPGISLYGINPLSGKDAFFSVGEKLEPVLEFHSTLVSKKPLITGEGVSYGLAFKAPWDMEIGIVPVGYYEGLPRALSNENYCLSHNGNSLPILGKICMNMCIVDITNKNISVGDKITIYSSEKNDKNSIIQASEKAGMISYEILVKIAESIRRKIVS